MDSDSRTQQSALGRGQAVSKSQATGCGSDCCALRALGLASGLPASAAQPLSFGIEFRSLAIQTRSFDIPAPSLGTEPRSFQIGSQSFADKPQGFPFRLQNSGTDPGRSTGKGRKSAVDLRTFPWQCRKAVSLSGAGTGEARSLEAHCLGAWSVRPSAVAQSSPSALLSWDGVISAKRADGSKGKNSMFLV